jgi:membrane associated rhomboid family serine protease
MMKVTADASVRQPDVFFSDTGLRTAATVAWPQRKQTIALSAISVLQFEQSIVGVCRARARPGAAGTAARAARRRLESILAGMFPLRDVIPTRTWPVVTVGLIALNAAIFVYQQTLGDLALERFVREWGLVPAVFAWDRVVTSMFLHGGWAHIGGNMLYLWIFGDNVEDRLGHGRYLVFYLLCGAAAALAQTAFHPRSAIPMIGASGAISGVLGAYLLLFPHSRVLTLVPILIFIQLIEVPAILLLGLWFLMQLLSGLGSLATQADMGGIAFWAHVAGFVAGVVLVHVFKQPERQKVEWWDGVR